jgi:hypothetical protein
MSETSGVEKNMILTLAFSAEDEHWEKKNTPLICRV